MIVVKFGGTSLAETERIRAAARIVAAKRRDQSVVCVVSAMAGVTDALIRLVEQTTPATATLSGDLFAALRTRHSQTMTELTTTATGTVSTPTSDFERAWGALEADLAALRQATFTSPEARAHAVAAFSGWGERLSVLLFAAALVAEGVAPHAFADEPVWLTERPGVRAAADSPRGAPIGADVPWEWLTPSVAATRARLADDLRAPLAYDTIPVLPGYLARTADGLVTTLGRNGSDSSAALIAAALQAEALYIYTDVAGVRRADPRYVPEAELLPVLTYADAIDLTELGASVLHPATLRPLAAAGIPLYLLNAFAPDAPGTLITSAARLRRESAAETTSATPAAVAPRSPWVVVAQPISPARPLTGMREQTDARQVEVAAVFLRHAEIGCSEDDQLSSGQPYDAATTADVPRGGANAAQRISVVVPIEESAAAQRRLYTALQRADERAARLGHDGEAERVEQVRRDIHSELAAASEATQEWRRSS